MNEFNNKIFRNEYNKSLAGVASGLAEGFDVDVTVVRLLFVLSSIFLPFSGAIVYVVLWIIAPVNRNPKLQNNFYRFNQNFQNQSADKDAKDIDDLTQKSEPLAKNPWEFNYKSQLSDDGAFTPKHNFKRHNKSTGKLIGGVILILIGLQFLMKNFFIYNIFDYIDKLWPVSLILIGIFLLMRFKDQKSFENSYQTNKDAPNKPVENQPEEEAYPKQSND